MSLSFGRTQLSIPGPSMFPDRVLNAMHQAAPNIYAGPIVELTARIKRDLQAVARTKAEALIYIANGHGGWEAALSNVVNPGDRMLALATGRFTKGWVEMAERLGADVEIMDFGTDAGIDPQAVEDQLRADKGHEFTAVLAVQTDTASSVSNDIAALRRAMDAAGHPALLMVDCIASLACEPFEMDEWGVDVMVAASQKGLMTPPGLAFNFVNDKARAARARCTQTTGYWDWTMRLNPEIYYMNFYGTAPTHHLFGLGEALDILLREEGLEAAWARHDILARAVWAAVEAWGAGGNIRCNVGSPHERSRAVTAILTDTEDAERLRDWTDRMCGVTLGVGLGLHDARGSNTPGLFRIGHMGHLNPPMLFGTLATIDAGLKALNIAHGAGAMEAATAVVANAVRSG